MSEFVEVHCSVPNGVVLRNYEAAPRTDGGEIRFVPVGDPVELKPGVNQVDAEFFRVWSEANSDSDLVINNLVSWPEQEKK